MFKKVGLWFKNKPEMGVLLLPPAPSCSLLPPLHFLCMNKPEEVS